MKCRQKIEKGWLIFIQKFLENPWTSRELENIFPLKTPSPTSSACYNRARIPSKPPGYAIIQLMLQLFLKYFIQSFLLSLVPFSIGVFMLFMTGLQGQPNTFANIFGYIGLALFLVPIFIFLRGAILLYQNTSQIQPSKNKRIGIAVLLFLSFLSPLIFYWLLQLPFWYQNSPIPGVD